MRHFDLAPLYRNTVGFDRLFSMLDQLVSVDAAPTYPPYNIERTGENAYRISVAVAGFTDKDLVDRGEGERSLDPRREELATSASPTSSTRASRRAPSSGVSSSPTASRSTGAALENGLLHVDLVREIPEAKKPKLIPIASARSGDIEAKQAA